MRCVFIPTLIFLSVAGASAAETASFTAPVTVVIDHAKILRLPERTQTVIVGNPIIADVAIQKSGILVLTAKSFGRTNLIALDAGGGVLAESMVSVQAPDDAIVTVQRGLDRESYSCNPRCQPSMLLGDAGPYFEQVGAQAARRNGLASGGDR